MMKKITLLALLIGFTFGSFAQEDKGKSVPNVKVKDLEGKYVNTGELSNEGKPMVINFWATWCGPCKKELGNIHEVYPDWVDETGVKVVAVSIDDSRTASRIKPYVETQGWEFEILSDVNSDFMRALGGNNPPFTILVDGAGKIVYTHSGYSEGDEEELYDHILELVE